MIRQLESSLTTPRSSQRIAGAVIVLSLSLTGCDFVKSFFQGPTAKPVAQPAAPPKKKDPAKAAVTPAPATVARMMSLSLSPPIATRECQITLSAAQGQVPAILQIANYADKKSESYPSVFIQATVPSAAIKDLLGQELDAKVYVARSITGPFFSTPEGQMAKVTLKTADDQHVSGEIAAATLVDQASGQSATATGKFDGKLLVK